MTEKATISPRQARTLTLLAQGLPVAEVCRQSMVNRSTLYRWLEQPHFKAAVDAATAAAIDDLTRRLTALGAQAADTLASTMADPQAPASTKVQAARAVLENLLRLRELVNLETRIAALEKAVGDGDQ